MQRLETVAGKGWLFNFFIDLPWDLGVLEEVEDESEEVSSSFLPSNLQPKLPRIETADVIGEYVRDIETIKLNIGENQRKMVAKSSKKFKNLLVNQSAICRCSAVFLKMRMSLCRNTLKLFILPAAMPVTANKIARAGNIATIITKLNRD